MRAIIATALAAVAIMTACGNKKGTEGTAPAAPTETATLKIDTTAAPTDSADSVSCRIQLSVIYAQTAAPCALNDSVKGMLRCEYFTPKATDTGEGTGLWEAPRGALLHCEKIKNNKITHYQAVVPTAWNISPRDNDDIPGTIEQALIGTPVANVKAPINALRIVHGYDPCIACAIHVVEPKTGKEFEMHTTPWGGR